MLIGSVLTVPKEVFMLFVCLATVTPRMPFDPPFSIGGQLSSSFRKFMIAIVTIQLLRNYLPVSKNVNYCLQAMEGILNCLQSLLTPYLLRVWLKGVRNFPGSQSPGLGLMPWLYANNCLTITGVVLRIWTGDKKMWIFKKVADAISFIPVYQTLGMYNQFQTGQAVRYPGRGTMLSQIVMCGEFYALFAHSTDIGIKLLLMGGIDPKMEKMNLVKGLYADNTFAVYSRLLCHSILLNTLDEMSGMYEIRTTEGNASTSTAADEASTTNTRTSNKRHNVTVEMVDDDEEQSMTLVKRT